MMRHLTTLEEIRTEVWRQLEQATQDKEHAWRTPVLAIINGQEADARTVVLREIDARDRRLLIYTDERASKVPTAPAAIRPPRDQLPPPGRIRPERRGPKNRPPVT